MLEPVPLVNATCQGTSPQPACVPPTIFVKFPFLVDLPCWEPEQAAQVPLRTTFPQVRGGGQQAKVTEI